ECHSRIKDSLESQVIGDGDEGVPVGPLNASLRTTSSSDISPANHEHSLGTVWVCYKQSNEDTAEQQHRDSRETANGLVKQPR
ncbi:MAG TPA: hypothetical protein VGU20_26100, partial [Stellaceae bacterium]|nr:hypothetical protein [Stellaceae bacterium]